MSEQQLKQRIMDGAGELLELAQHQSGGDDANPKLGVVMLLYAAAALCSNVGISRQDFNRICADSWKACATMRDPNK